MRIIVVGPQFPDSFARNISVTLAAMGHQVGTVEGLRQVHQGNRFKNAIHGFLPQILPGWERATYQDLIRTCKTQQPDLVLVTYCTMPPYIVREIKNVCGCKLACWYTDSIMNLGRFYLGTSEYDALFVKEPLLARMLKEKLGLNAHYLPECCNSVWHKPLPPTERELEKYGCDLAAIGSLHYWRARVLETFDGYDLKIWGHNCPSWLESPAKKYYTNHFVAETEKAKALGAAKIVLTIIHFTEIEGVSWSLFETAGCGAFQIADWKPSIAELFEPDRELVTYRTRQELKEKVDYFLAHPEERREIASRASARAHRDHIYEVRLKTMFEVVGLPSSTRVSEVAQHV